MTLIFFQNRRSKLLVFVNDLNFLPTKIQN
jgi:hypothetical protein